MDEVTKLKQQIYKLEEKLSKLKRDDKGKYPVEYYSISGKITKLKKQVIEIRQERSWNEYLSK